MKCNLEENALNSIVDWQDFNAIVTETMKKYKTFECCKCNFAGLGVISGHREMHCLDHAKNGNCLFYNNNKNAVDQIINSQNMRP